jgi:hypothetical protein
MDGTLFADGFDAAVIGVDFNHSVPRVVYSIPAMAEILMKRDGMDYFEAVEFIQYNVISAHLGDGTPIYIEPMSHSDALEQLTY